MELAPGVRVDPSVVRFSYSSSGGPGGQNVNKRATKAELRVRIGDLPIHAEARDRLAAFAGSRVTDDGELVLTSDEHRSQIRNREECLERLRELIVKAKVRPKTRRATKPSRGAKERRLQAKREVSERKRSRRSSEDA
jgi:ribosome-associated protein